MKHVPTPDSSVSAALIELQRLENEWHTQQAADQAEREAALARARGQQERHQRELKVKARQAADRRRRKEARRKGITDRYETIKVAEVRARAQAEARARVEAMRIAIDAQLRPRHGRLIAGCLATLVVFGLAALGLDGYYERQDAEYERARAEHAAFMDRMEERSAQVASLRAGWDDLAARHEGLEARRVALLEAIRANVEATEREAVRPSKPRPVERPTVKPKPKPKPPQKPTIKRPPIVLNPDGDPLDGLD
jgi:hypothetical protein